MAITRRSLSKGLAKAVAAAAFARESATAQPAEPPTNDDLASARAQLKANLDQISKVKLPMAVEPAFRFKA